MFQKVATTSDAPEASSNSNHQSSQASIEETAIRAESAETTDRDSEVNNGNAPVPAESHDNTNGTTSEGSSSGADTSNKELPSNVLERYFSEIQTRLQEEDYPSEYTRGTFWITPKMPFFALKSKHFST
ncbi:hypothetical protein MBANPS3_012384 [Mucor bainieri]